MAGLTRSKIPTLEDIREVLTPALEESTALRAIVFGSHARGEAREFSDLDLVIVADSERGFVSRFKDFQTVRDAWNWSMDLIVYTPAEYERMRAQGSYFIELLETEGVVIYERWGLRAALYRCLRPVWKLRWRSPKSGERNPAEGARWLRQAEHELQVARLFLREGFWRHVCRYSNFAAEFSLKALAYYRGDRKAWEHSLEVLLENVADTFPDLAALSPDAERLNDYRVATRYPGAFPDDSPHGKYQEGEATEALQAAERIFAVARENIPAPAE